jgi:hypothetical protein
MLPSKPIPSKPPTPEGTSKPEWETLTLDHGMSPQAPGAIKTTFEPSRDALNLDPGINHTRELPDPVESPEPGKNLAPGELQEPSGHVSHDEPAYDSPSLDALSVPSHTRHTIKTPALLLTLQACNTTLLHFCLLDYVTTALLLLLIKCSCATSPSVFNHGLVLVGGFQKLVRTKSLCLTPTLLTHQVSSTLGHLQ